MKFKINYQLLPIKAHYFLIFAGTAPIVPFLPVYARQLGFDSFGVGIIYAVLPFAAMMSKPVAGWLADKYTIKKTVFMFSIVLAAVFFFSLQVVPSIALDNSGSFHCTSPISLVQVCRDETKMSVLNSALKDQPCPDISCRLTCAMSDERTMRSVCSAFSNTLPGCSSYPTTPLDATSFTVTIRSNLSVHDGQYDPRCLTVPVDQAVHNHTDVIDRPVCVSDETKVDDCHVVCENEDVEKFVRKGSIFSSYQFWIFFVLIVMAYSSFAVTTSMGDALCFDLLEGKHQKFGQQRVFGSLGWGIFTILAGYLVDSNSSDGHKNYTPAFLLMAGMLVLDLLCSWKMKINPSVKPESWFHDTCQLLSSPRVLVFVLWCVTVGVLTSTIWQWLPWYLTDQTNFQEVSCEKTDTSWVTLLIGLDMGIQCFVGETPMFFFSGWLLHKIGHIPTMTLVLGAFGIRLLLYSLISSPWLALPIEILQGITFGVFYATMTSYAYVITPPGLGATLQGIVGAAFEGAGLAIGSLVGGTLYKTHGGVFLFRAFGIFSLAMCLLHVVVQMILDKFCKKQQLEGGRPKGFEVVATFDTGGGVEEPVRIKNYEAEVVERPIIKDGTKETLVSEVGE